MSVVTNAVLSARYMARPDHLALRERHWVEVGRHAGGNKAFEADTYAKAFNHTSFEQIVAEITECLEYVQGCVLVIHHEYDNEDDPNEVHVWSVRAWRSRATFWPATAWGDPANE